jgi:hypothetical protein
LISLAVVSTTYVGFSALLVGLRQAKGSHLTSCVAYLLALELIRPDIAQRDQHFLSASSARPGARSRDEHDTN